VTWYGQEVFRKTSEISKQVYPFTLDIDHPRWIKNLNKMEEASRQIAAAKARGGIEGGVARMAGMAKAGFYFISTLLIPSIPNDVPESPRMEPVY
jgi:magnesium-protoporphyrin IX monomethyl ester (oxidative) cyclase